MQEWFRQVNPHALHNIVDKLLDAAQRHVWEANPSTVEELENTYADIEGTIEEVSDDPRSPRTPGWVRLRRTLPVDLTCPSWG